MAVQRDWLALVWSRRQERRRLQGAPDFETAVVNCIAFGSKNSALVVRRWD